MPDVFDQVGFKQRPPAPDVDWDAAGFRPRASDDGFDSAYQQVVQKRAAMGMPLNPNPDDPNHHYDYRAAFRQFGPTMGMGNDGHFPSIAKHVEHDNRFVNGWDTLREKPDSYNLRDFAAETSSPADPFDSAGFKPLDIVQDTIRNYTEPPTETDAGTPIMPPLTTFDAAAMRDRAWEQQQMAAYQEGEPVGVREAIVQGLQPGKAMRTIPGVGSIMSAAGLNLDAPAPRPEPSGNREFDVAADQSWMADQRLRQVEAERPRTFGAKVADVVQATVPFAGEMAMGGAGATGEALLSGGVKAAFKRAATTSAKAMPYFSPRIVADARERMQPQFEYQAAKDGLLREAVVDMGDDVLPALGKALASTAIEVVSEQSGEVLGAFGALATKIPGVRVAVERLGEFKAALVGKLLDATGLQLPEFVNRLKQFGYHGVLAEMGEERVAEAMNGALDVVAPGYGQPFALPGLEQLGVEAAAFAVPGMANVGMQFAGAQRTGKPGTVEQPIVTPMPMVQPPPTVAPPAMGEPTPQFGDVQLVEEQPPAPPPTEPLPVGQPQAQPAALPLDAPAAPENIPAPPLAPQGQEMAPQPQPVEQVPAPAPATAAPVVPLTEPAAPTAPEPRRVLGDDEKSLIELQEVATRTLGDLKAASEKDLLRTIHWLDRQINSARNKRNEGRPYNADLLDSFEREMMGVNVELKSREGRPPQPFNLPKGKAGRVLNAPPVISSEEAQAAGEQLRGQEVTNEQPTPPGFTPVEAAAPQGTEAGPVAGEAVDTGKAGGLPRRAPREVFTEITELLNADAWDDTQRSQASAIINSYYAGKTQAEWNKLAPDQKRTYQPDREHQDFLAIKDRAKREQFQEFTFPDLPGIRLYADRDAMAEQKGKIEAGGKTLTPEQIGEEWRKMEAKPYREKKPAKVGTTEPKSLPKAAKSRDEEIGALKPFTAKENTRFAIADIFVTPDRAVATDGWRLAIVDAATPGGFADLHRPPPAAEVAAAKKRIPALERAVAALKESRPVDEAPWAQRMAWNTKQDKAVAELDRLRAIVTSDKGTFFSATGTKAKRGAAQSGTAGVFPAYESAMDLADYHSSDFTEVDSLEAIRNIRKAAILTDKERPGVVVVRNTNGTIGFAAWSPSVGQVEINVDDGHTVLGGVHPQFLLDAFDLVSRSGEGTAEFAFPQPDRPVVIRAGRFKSIIMPMQDVKAAPSEVADEETGDEQPEQKSAASSGGGGSSEASRPITGRPTFTPAPGTAVGAARTQVSPMATPELVKLARAITGHIPSVRKMREAWGRFYPSTGNIKIHPELGKDPVELASTLAHEIGHAIDWAPTREMRRGNLLGRLFTLRGFLKNTFGGTSVTNKEVRKELMDLSQWWRAWDPAKLSKSKRAYYSSAKELYADAMSVLLNSPGELETRAPKFYRTFFEALDRKPNVRDAYLTLQDMINGVPADLQQMRRADLREGFARGETVWRARQEEARAAKTGLIAKIKQVLIDKAAPVIDAENAAIKAGARISDAESARFAMDELNYREAVGRVFLEDVERTVWQPMREAGLTMDDVGEFMAYRRMINERVEIANPLGHNPDTAQEAMDNLERELGKDKFDALQKHVQRFDDLVFKVAEEAVDVGVYNADTFNDVIVPNKGNYAAFAVVDYLEANMPAGIRQQVGTFKEIANPFVATTMKTLSLHRAIELNRAKNKVRDMLKRYHSGEIKKKPHAPGGQPRRPDPGNEHLVVMENGNTTFYEVDKYIARAFERNDIGVLAEIGRFVSAITYKPFHALYVTASPGFAVANIFRDIKRTHKNLVATRERGKPAPTLRDVIKAYWDSRGVAWKRARKQFDPLLREMMEQKAIDVPFASYDYLDVDESYDRLLKRYGMGEDTPGRSRIVNLLTGIFRGAEALSVFTETLPKVASYKMLRDRGVGQEFTGYVVRNYVGTPNFKTKGLATEITNGLFMYSNVVLQGLRADAQIATRPKTAGGYWTRAAMVDFLPKVAQAAAKAGLFGAALAALMRLIPDSDLKKYLCIPLGATHDDQTGETKAVYLRIPHDDTNRPLVAMLWDALQGKFSGIAEEMYGEVPGISPPLEMAHNWAQFASGRNPYDAFRGRDVISRDAWSAGGWYAGEEMVRWTLDQFGVASTIMHGFIGKPGTPARETTVEKIIGSVPGLSRILKISNRGMYEDEWSEVREEEAEGARRRLKLDDLTRSMLRERYRLTRLGDERLTDRDRVRRVILNEHYKVYLDVTMGIKAAEERGDDDEAKRLRKVIADVSKQMSEATDNASRERE